MSQHTQYRLLSEQSRPLDYNRIYEQLIQVFGTEGYHSSAAPPELQGQPSLQEILSAPYPGYASHTITPIQPLSRTEKQDNTVPKHGHLPNQELVDVANQSHPSFSGSEPPPLGDVLQPLLITSNGAADLSTPLTTADFSGPRVIKFAAAEHDLRTVGSRQIQQAAGKRRKKDGIYQCHFRNTGCSATFTAPHNLRYHLNAHRGLKLYKCTTCSYAGDSPTTLKRHMKRHPSGSIDTGNTIEETYAPKPL